MSALSETVEIDNSAPTVSAAGQPQISGERARIAFEAADAASFISKAEYSVNGGEWQTVYSDDGISDEEELLHREVIQGDADLYYLHHYLSEVFRNGDNF